MTMATANPWYGYKRIAVMCRRAGQTVKDREAYAVMKDHGLLQRPKTRRAEVHQAAKLFELLPQRPNDLWQMDVTYIHIPGHGWWYAVTVIDYYSRYLLACHLTPSYSAIETAYALKLARAEAERLHGPLARRPFLVTDNGPSFIARRFTAFIADQYSHVRIQYRTPQQLGLLERFHGTLKTEEVYWRLYDHPQHCRACLAEFRERYNERRPHWRWFPRRAAIRGFRPRCTPATERSRFRAGNSGPARRRRSWRRCWRKRREEDVLPKISLASGQRPGRPLPPLDPG